MHMKEMLENLLVHTLVKFIPFARLSARVALMRMAEAKAPVLKPNAYLVWSGTHVRCKYRKRCLRRKSIRRVCVQ